MAELGVFSLILAFLFAGLTVLLPSLSLMRKKDLNSTLSFAMSYARAQFIFVAIAYGCLTLCFLNDDFSVIYVLANSSVSLPWFYKVCAVWGGHEGSMLLWVFILSAWMMAVCLGSKSLDKGFRCRLIIVLAALSFGFFLFLLATSNPFSRQFQQLAVSGRDLNPLLQDPGFLFHPPVLYMGYVGFSIAFAFAIAALWMGRLDSTWAKWTRPWTLIAWCFLTAGITLGSWWAYRELGWGGWWFWDPVENASFMPWLVGTALIHALIVSEKRQRFIAWTLLLAIIGFSLSLVGTFLVRSGVLTSVHAFAVDPTRGLFILLFLAVVIGSALFLFAFRAPKMQGETGLKLLSRESLLLLNSIFFVVLMLTVLMGTVYPLIVDGLGLGKLSVGLPYFNTVFRPLMIPVLILMGLSLHVNWQADSFDRLLKQLKGPLILSLFLPALLLIFLTDRLDLYCLLGLSLALWIYLASLKFLLTQIRERGLLSLRLSFLGMIFAHLGVATTLIGIAVSSSYGLQDDLKLAPGQTAKIGSYRIRFVQEKPLKGPNYTGTQVKFELSDGKQSRWIYPEKRYYTVAKMTMTDAAIDVTAFRDIYIALGEPLSDGAWSLRLYYKPFVRWIWAGGFMILLGGLLCLSQFVVQRALQAKSLGVAYDP